VRIVIGEDEALLREGLARLLTDAEIDVVGTAGGRSELEDLVSRLMPDVAIIDIKMPPTHTDEGLLAAQEIRRRHPGVAVLLLSHYLDSNYAMRLLEEHSESVGYLLKDRVSDIAVLVDALRRVHEGESVIDPTIVQRLVRRRREHDALDELTNRELEVLALMAEGHSNHAIELGLVVSPKTVEAHIRQIFMKLGFEEAPDQHRRVLAVLAYLRRRG
jgi:DNA-binding NarL/FixJ family response regulator